MNRLLRTFIYLKTFKVSFSRALIFLVLISTAACSSGSKKTYCDFVVENKSETISNSEAPNNVKESDEINKDENVKSDKKPATKSKTKSK